jgi:uncharacterized membrane protein
MVKNKMNHTHQWMIIGIGSVIGLLASFIQTIERINYADNAGKVLSCDISNTISCSNIFSAWQSSFFGFPNSIMSLTFFAILFGVSLSGLLGGQISKSLRLWLHFFSVFFLLFGGWYLYQSAIVISAVCIFCIFNYLGVIILNWGWLRLNVDDLPFSKGLKALITKGADTFFWIMWGLVFVGMFILKFN